MAPKKTAPKKAPAKAKKTNTPVGYFNLELELVSGDTLKFNSIAIFGEGSYVDKKAVHLVDVARRRGGEMVQTMKCTIKAYTPAVLPEDDQFVIEGEEEEKVA